MSMISQADEGVNPGKHFFLTALMEGRSSQFLPNYLRVKRVWTKDKDSVWAWTLFLRGKVCSSFKKK